MGGVVESARFIETVDNQGAAEEYLGMNVGHSGEPTGELVLQGTPASPGIAIGAAVFRRAFPRELARSLHSGAGRRPRGPLQPHPWPPHGVDISESAARSGGPESAGRSAAADRGQDPSGS